MNAEGKPEIWQIESGGQIIDANFEQITQMIDRGDLLRMDRVRKGDLRWIEAGKVPALISVFNAKDGDAPPKPVITLTKLGPTSVPGGSTSNRINAQPVVQFQGETETEPPILVGVPMCSMHADVPAFYICGTCFSHFCKACPASYGGTVKICPYCGAMCEPIAKVEAAKTQTAANSAARGSGFGLGDFIEALTYPFKFKTSLILGAVMYMMFSIGTGATAFGGIFMMAAAIGCFMLANTLTFGVLSNTVENFAQGKIGDDFMPSFDEFSIWDDVVHPFFLSVGVWMVSFGPLIVLIIATFFFLAGAVNQEMNAVQSDAAQTVAPDLPYAAKAANQSQVVRDLINRTNEQQKRRIEQMERDESESYQPEPQQPASIAPEAEEYSRKSKLPPESQNKTTQSVGNVETPAVDDSEQAVMRANEIIQQTRKAQLESALGKTPETRAKEQSELLKQILGYGAIFLLVGGLCLLWGLFYFPAACAVAGYTQSFRATLNPTVGLDTIRRLGLDYVKILLMGLAIVIMSGIVSGVFGVVFSAFDMPGVGNIPAKAFGSLFGFYFSVVFSCVLGFAMFKASDRLKLPS